MKTLMDGTIAALALLTGVLFALLRAPIPAPSELPGVLGIVGIYLGDKGIERLGVGVDLLSALGLR